MKWFLILSFIPLLGIIYQDFKVRAISWYWIPILFSLFALYTFNHLGKQSLTDNLLLNNTFILINLIIVFAYFSIKNKTWINLFKTHLGLGDVLFFICLTAILPPINFILFFVISLLITSFVSILMYFLRNKQTQSIPLAAWMSLQFCLLLLTDLSTEKDLLQDKTTWLSYIL